MLLIWYKNPMLLDTVPDRRISWWQRWRSLSCLTRTISTQQYLAARIHLEVCAKIIEIGQNCKELDFGHFLVFNLRGNISFITREPTWKITGYYKVLHSQKLAVDGLHCLREPHTTTNWLKHRSKNFWHHQQCKTVVTSLGLSLDSEKPAHAVDVFIQC